MDTTELELELLELEDLHKHTRNSIDRTKYADRIAELKSKIAESKTPEIEQKAVLQKDVPARADHIDEKIASRELITNPGDTFTALL